MDWLDRTNLLADPGGVIECLLGMETNAPACFYRLKGREGVVDPPSPAVAGYGAARG